MAGLSTYLNNLIRDISHNYQKRNAENVRTYQCRTETFRSSFFSRTAVEWNKYLNIKHVSHLNFKYHLLKEIPPPD